ncbi:hypothetical protein [Fibrobacter sp. UWB11]|uniref:hypothetical protein n=1 Tax=Fibrobacter sp. UWB11 TaxID=1896202 RepID=UPI00092A5ED5|nr:hypothetical protein [Fibrobacter sp. UWB11]SIO04239.1 hypothetical protein SAMN05720758_1142 [Fibrobacter sp. UWB11]
MKAFLIGLALATMVYAEIGSSPVIGSERTRNLRGLDYAPMLFEYHRQTVGEGRHFFTYPRRDTTFQKDFYKNHKNAMAFFENDSNSSHRFAIAVSPILGIDYKSSSVVGDTIWPSIDGGLFIRGFADSLDFDLDARIYAEGHSAKKPKSYDYEVFDVQSKDNGDGGIDYVSFARYRAHFAFNYAWARLQLARDVLHWGPGYYNNLSLNQFALPYNMLSLDLTFGPLRIYTIYADLRVDSWSYSMDNLNDRNLYAHRYELAFKNVTFGISELQVLYNENKPWLFVPVAPLFIEKGNYSEHVNNGALAFDFNVQLFKMARVYGEFFLDDMESPYAVYQNRYSNNRWAAMFGFQIARDMEVKGKALQLGTIAEMARVEPFTYCHYDTAQAQIAHLGLPLGNPNGPNSLAIDWTLYSRLFWNASARFFFSLHNKWLWKGIDYGSNIDDPYKTKRKKFINNAPLQYTIAPSFSYSGQYASFELELLFGENRGVFSRATFHW